MQKQTSKQKHLLIFFLTCLFLSLPIIVFSALAGEYVKDIGLKGEITPVASPSPVDYILLTYEKPKTEIVRGETQMDNRGRKSENRQRDGRAGDQESGRTVWGNITAYSSNIDETEKSTEIEYKIRKIAEMEGFKEVDYLIKLAKCESSLNQFAIGDNGNSRGLFQIHKGFHPDVSNEEAFNIDWSTMWTIQMIESGNRRLWSCNKIVS